MSANLPALAALAFLALLLIGALAGAIVSLIHWIACIVRDCRSLEGCDGHILDDML